MTFTFESICIDYKISSTQKCEEKLAHMYCMYCMYYLSIKNDTLVIFLML